MALINRAARDGHQAASLELSKVAGLPFFPTQTSMCALFHYAKAIFYVLQNTVVMIALYVFYVIPCFMQIVC